MNPRDDEMTQPAKPKTPSVSRSISIPLQMMNDLVSIGNTTAHSVNEVIVIMLKDGIANYKIDLAERLEKKGGGFE